MWSTVRCALVWLVVLALPVQSLAASTMLWCGPAHERPLPSPATMHHAGSTTAGHDHAVGHDHAIVHDAAVVDEPAVAPVDDGRTKRMNSAAQPDDVGCSACASCCSMPAIPVGLAGVDGPGFVSPRATVLDAGVVSFVTAGPERPPRIHLA